MNMVVNWNKMFVVALFFLIGFFIFFNLSPDSAFAETQIPTIGGATAGTEDIESTIEDMIWKIRIIGALIVIVCIILGFIIVGLSLGNAQKRSIGISAVVAAAIAIYGIAKAPALANYMIDDAQSNTSSITNEESIQFQDTIKYTL